MSLFTIYHVVGIKVGCTKEYDTRCMQNRMTYGDDIVIEILEEHSGTEQSAALVEKRYARQFGYNAGNDYDKAIEARRAMGKKGAQSPQHASQRRECQVNWQKAGVKAASVLLTCPHCGKTAPAGPMIRWHFDRCKRKPLTEQISLT